MPLEGVGAPVLVKAPLPVGFTWTVVFPIFPLISSRSVNWFDIGPPAFSFVFRTSVPLLLL